MKNKLYTISAAILILSTVLCACSKNTTETKNSAAATEETATTAVAVVPDVEPETETKVVTYVDESGNLQTSVIAVTKPLKTTQPTQTVTYVDESGYNVVSIVVPTTEKWTHPPVPTHKPAPTYKEDSLSRTQAGNKPHTHPPVGARPTQKPKPGASVTAADNQKPASTKPLVTVPEKSNGLTLLFKTERTTKGNSATVTVNGTKGKEYTIEVYRDGKNLLTSDSLKPVKADANGLASWTFSTGGCDYGYRKIVIKEKGSSKYIQTSILVI